MRPGPVVFAVLYLAAQIALAVRAPLRPNQISHFGWRMFLDSARFVRFEIGFRDGRVLDLDALEPKLSLPLLGAQVDLPRFVPPYLCLSCRTPPGFASTRRRFAREALMRGRPAV